MPCRRWSSSVAICEAPTTTTTRPTNRQRDSQTANSKQTPTGRGDNKGLLFTLKGAQSCRKFASVSLRRRLSCPLADRGGHILIHQNGNKSSLSPSRSLTRLTSCDYETRKVAALLSPPFRPTSQPASDTTNMQNSHQPRPPMTHLEPRRWPDNHSLVCRSPAGR